MNRVLVRSLEPPLRWYVLAFIGSDFWRIGKEFWCDVLWEDSGSALKSSSWLTMMNSMTVLLSSISVSAHDSSVDLIKVGQNTTARFLHVIKLLLQCFWTLWQTWWVMDKCRSMLTYGGATWGTSAYCNFLQVRYVSAFGNSRICSLKMMLASDCQMIDIDPRLINSPAWTNCECNSNVNKGSGKSRKYCFSTLVTAQISPHLSSSLKFRYVVRLKVLFEHPNHVRSAVLAIYAFIVHATHFYRLDTFLYNKWNCAFLTSDLLGQVIANSEAIITWR